MYFSKVDYVKNVKIQRKTIQNKKILNFFNEIYSLRLPASVEMTKNKRSK